MTCRQLGGPCNHSHRGETADDVIRSQDEHLEQMVESGDDEHQPARDEMKARWRRPISGMKWYRQAKKDFAEISEVS
ncbi:MAG TPA: hypothetical protein VES40_18645 [Ilumatobacteraceae bacterium]|nr:hypothetical protein [Ilumatobacteraceae bacterium]